MFFSPKYIDFMSIVLTFWSYFLQILLCGLFQSCHAFGENCTETSDCTDNTACTDGTCSTCTTGYELNAEQNVCSGRQFLFLAILPSCKTGYYVVLLIFVVLVNQ